MGRSISVQSAHYSYAALYRHIAAFQNELVYGGHLTALGAPVKVLTVSILVNVPVNIPLLFIAYLAPLIVYNVDYYQSLDKDMATNRERTMFLAGKAGIFPYLIAFYVALLLVSLALFANSGLILLTAMLGLCGVMYSTVFKGLTKKIPGFKNVFTSGIWATGVAFGLPLYYSLPLDSFFVCAFLFIFLRSLGNVVFFDLKDVESDAAESLKTVPVLLGKERTVMLLKAMNLISFLPLIAGVYLHIMPVYTLSMVALAATTFFYLDFTNGNGVDRKRHSYYMLADAETMLWPVLLLIGKALFFSI